MMNIEEYKLQLRENVIIPMTEFMEDGGDFSKEDIAECETLMLDYLNALETMTLVSDEEIMNCVKNVVVALNDLNEKTDYSLIETMEREALAEIIQDAAVSCGLSDIPEDVTEEWREW